MENQNASISFILKFQDEPTLQEVKVLNFLNVPVVISKPQQIEGNTYYSELPIGVISNFTVFRDGIAFNSNIWMQFTEGVDLGDYKATCEFSADEKENTLINGFMLVPKTTENTHKGTIETEVAPAKAEVTSAEAETPVVDTPTKPKKRAVKKAKEA